MTAHTAVALLVAVAAAAPRLEAPPLVEGETPRLTAAGLRPGQIGRLHVMQRGSRWMQGADKQWRPQPVLLHGWGDYRADGRGRIDPARQAVLRGSYSGRDAYGLFWSGRRRGDPSSAGVDADALYTGLDKDGQRRALLMVGGQVVDSADLRRADPPDLVVRPASEPGLDGVYAAPRDGGPRPALILLHGSEGGGREEARALAVRFAGRGYAALAVNYFAWDLKGLAGVPDTHIDTPIEGVALARDWLGRQPEADVNRLGLYGHSKGAEFAEVAAVRYPWVRAVVACVPTDVVWEGYGHDDERNRPENRRPRPAVMSSWSFGGAPLPYVPLRPFRFGEPSPYFDNTERYELSRRDHPAEAAAAAIPIERARARFLLLGGGRDEVWASGAMAERLAQRMRRAGRSADVRLRVYPRAGHQICSDGASPPRMRQEDSGEARRKDLDAEGAAAADAWGRIQTFFAETLEEPAGPPPRERGRGGQRGRA